MSLRHEADGAVLPFAPHPDPGRVSGSYATEASAPLRGEGARVWIRRCAMALALGLAYGLLLQATFWFVSPVGGAAFFPAAGLALAVLALTPRRTWPLWLTAFATAQIVVYLWHDRPVAPTFLYALADVVEPVIGALLLAAALRRRRGPRAALISFTLFAVLFAPIVSAVIGASANVWLAHAHRTWWEAASRWWVADALGVLVIGSLILAWSLPTAFETRPPLGVVAAVAAAGAAAIVVSGVLWHYPLVYIVLPGLVWAAFVGGGRAVTFVGASAALAADWVAITGRAGRLVASPPRTQQLDFLQLFVFVTFLTGLVLAAEIAERRRSEQERATIEEAAVRVAEAERQTITQETHDIVGHGLSAMVLQIGAARRLLESDPAAAGELLQSSEALGRKAAGDLDVALSLLGHEDGPEGRGTDEIPELVSALGDAGLSVELTVEGERGDISTLVDWSAYRIVREALTNVLKHAPAAATTVTLRYDDDAIRLAVVNRGGLMDRNGSSEEGRGIVGMRERAAALGGTLEVGPTPGGGFAVTAKLPITQH